MDKWDTHKNADRINLALILTWTLFAFLLFPNNGCFRFDQAYFWNEALDVAKFLHFPVHGPSISFSRPTAFVPGGSFYLILAVPFLFFTDPRVGILWMAALSALAIYVMDCSFRRYRLNPSFRVLAVGMCLWSPWHSDFELYLWNVNIFWFTIPLLVTLALDLLGSQKIELWRFFAFGILSAVSMQIHFGAILALGAFAGTALLLKPKLFTVKTLGVLIAGILVPYLPYLAHELCTDFANTHALANVPKLYSNVALTAVRSLWNSLQMVTPFTYFEDRTLRLGASLIWILPATLVGLFNIGIFLKTISYRRQNFFTLSGSIAFLLIPIYFVLNHRNYVEHYVLTAAPLMILSTAWGLDSLYQNKKWRCAVAGIWVAFMVFSALFSIQMRIFKDAPDWRFPEEKRIVKTALDRNAHPVLDSDIPGLDSFTYWILAKNLYQRELLFRGSLLPGICRVRIGNLPDDKEFRGAFISTDAYFECRK